MAVYFIDLDGTLFEHGTDRPLPGALEFVEEARARGHRIVLTTLRSSEWPEDHVLNDRHTLESLARLGVGYDEILFDLASPRILVSDRGAVAYSHLTNAAISGDERLRWLGGRPLRALRLGAIPAGAASADASAPTPRSRRIDPKALLAPISAETPSGPDLRYEATSGLLEQARALRRSASGDETGDGGAPTGRDAWTALLERSCDGLARESKDLELGMLVCEALLALDGPWGLAEGLALVEGLLAAFWPSLHPGVEDDGEIVYEVRIAPLLRLSAASFDATLAAAPLAHTSDGRVFDLRGCEQAAFVDGLLRSDADRARALVEEGWTSPAALEGIWESLAPAALADAVRGVRAAGEAARRLESTCRERLGGGDAFDLYLFRSNLLDVEEILRGDRR